MSESTQTSTKQHEFNKFQQIFWPIHSYELKKFIPMSILMLCILFVYAMTRNLKDTFIRYYAVCGGSELTPILKFLIMPVAILVPVVFTFCVNKFGSRKTFYIMISSFALFYAIFLFVLLPNIEILQPNESTIRYLQSVSPGFMHYIIPCLTNWCYTLFYIVSEFWSVVALSLLFWQFANRITKEEETKRFYTLYSLISSLGVILSGGVLHAASSAKGAEFDRNARILIGLCIIFALIIMAIFYYINAEVVPDPKLCDQSQFRLPSKTMKKSKKIDILEGIKILMHSRYMGLIAIITCSYAISDNLLESVWKSWLENTYTNSSEFSSMMGYSTMINGTLTVIITIISTYILRKCSWRFCASIPAVAMLTFGLGFFLVCIYQKMGHAYIFNFETPIVASWFGLVAVAFIRSIKYCLFDATKNMAYRPLDVDTKTKGQAAVESIAGRGGKVGGAVVTSTLTGFVDVGSKISSHIYTIAPVFAISVIGWIFAALRLGPKYEKKVIENRENQQK